MNPSGEIQTAILKVIEKCPSLIKTSKNTHGSYNYVSIDDFYNKIVPIANAEGIHWHATETHNSIITVGAKGSLIAKLTYSFTLTYKDFSLPDYFVCTIFHPLIGAQTAGSALSYADKLFQRHVFKVQTGEGDADAAPLLDSESDLLADMGPSTAPVAKTLKHEPGPVVTGQHSIDVDALTNMVIDFCASCRTVTELQKYWDDNVSAINLVQGQDRKGYMEILNTFKTRKNQLTEA